MTKRVPNGLEQYTVTPLVQQLITGEFKPLSTTLTLRESYIWHRLGGVEKVRSMIAPQGICVHCAEEKATPDSCHGWFCFTCQRDLNHLGVLPYSD